MEDIELLIVGRHGPGGIGQYIKEQRRHLVGEMRVSAHKSGAFSTEGIIAFVLSAFVIVWNALTYSIHSPPDIVHVHSAHRFSFYRIGYYVLFSKYIWKCPVVLHIHGSSFDVFVSTESRLVRWYQGLIFDAADEIIVLSEYWEDILSEHMDETKLTVIPNTVNASDYVPAFDSGMAHVVSVSNQIPRKGIVELATALDNLAGRDLDFRVSIAGKGPLSKHIERLSAKHDNVEYLGYISETKKYELLSKGSIFVLPSHAEGLPIAILEAMAAGNAIVSTTVGAIPEVIGKENGLLVVPRDVDQLTDALAKLIADPDRVARMGEANREVVIHQYVWSMATDELLAMYKRHLDGTEQARQ